MPIEVTFTEARAKEIIRLCQREAALAILEGNSPFGCVITDLAGNVLAQAHNEMNTRQDPTAHAEIIALSALGQRRKNRRLSDCVLFANAESCSMCMSAGVKALIQHFYFGAAPEGSLDPDITVQEIAAKTKLPIKVNTLILAGECAQQITQGRDRNGTTN
jgi:tRNA(adenine34) deaminase